jgi:hypothetical protein
MGRAWRGAGRIGAVVAGLVVVSGSANAQSLLERIIGPAFEAPPPPPVQVIIAAPPPAAPSPPKVKPKFRAVCVRLCDGYYFPVAHDVSADRLSDFQDRCRSQCGAETRLFRVPTDKDIDDAVDEFGQLYSRLPNAYRYRRSLVNACTCRPAPWAESERQRHASYAVRAAIEAEKPTADATQRRSTTVHAAAPKKVTAARPAPSRAVGRPAQPPRPQAVVATVATGVLPGPRAPAGPARSSGGSWW